MTLKKGWNEPTIISLLFRDICSGPIVGTVDKIGGWIVITL